MPLEVVVGFHTLEFTLVLEGLSSLMDFQ